MMEVLIGISFTCNVLCGVSHTAWRTIFSHKTQFILSDSSFSGSFYEITLQEPLKAGGTIDIKFEEVYIKSLRPYPAQITQSEKQLVEFSGSVLVYSPYQSTSQTTTVKLASSAIESHTKVNPVSVNDEVITYGPYEDKEAYSKVHCKFFGCFACLTAFWVNKTVY